jgi:hypothetical protein
MAPIGAALKELRMGDLSIDEVWDDARRFFLRERALVLPIGFATFGLAALLAGVVVPAPQPPAREVPAGPWMFMLIPILLLVLTGYLALSRIALRSRLSVAEAIGDAVRFLPRGVLLLLGLGAIFLFLSLIAGMVGGLLSAIGGIGQGGMLMLALAIFAPAAFVVSVRCILLWPTLADQEGGVADTFRRSITLTQGNAWKIGGLLLAYMLIYLLLTAVIESVAGSILLLVTRMLHLAWLGPVLLSIVVAAFNAIYMSFWTIFLARLYARLAR